ncbi:MAG: tetratricopeptide repeat protein [Synergistaceae bacterium]|jgi:tetratricopeptide (TPR) repeat protein|nr:tetratricopeptide repeat protein [Synergistaceae bacterium]
MRKTVFILAATLMILWNAMPSEGASVNEEFKEFYVLLKQAMNAANSGQYLEAKEYYERVLPLCLKLFGEESPNTAEVLNDLGLVYHKLEDYPKAKKIYERALAIRLEVFGEESSHTAASLNNLGNIYEKLGNYPQAKEIHERALAVRLKLFGEVDPDVAVSDVAESLNNLGNVYDELGDYPKTKEYYERTLAILLTLFGEEHSVTAASLNNLGLVYEKLGNYPKAKEAHERALAIRLKLFGEEHPDTVMSLNNLGNIYEKLGDYPKAIETLERALAIQFGEVHEDTARNAMPSEGTSAREEEREEFYALSEHITNAENSGQYLEAKEYYERALPLGLKLLGEESPYIAGLLNDLGKVYEKLGDYPKAKKNCERALAIRLKVFGEESLYTAASLNNLGNIYEKLGDYPQAKETHERALAIYLKLFGEVHPDTATSFNSLGNADYKLGDYPKAKESYEQALAIRLKLFGEEHPHTAASFNNLGNVDYKLGDHSQAKANHERALAIRLKLFGEEHPDTAMSLNNLGEVYRTLGDYPQAKETHERALTIQLKLFGEEHPDTAGYFHNLGNVYDELGDYPKAKENYERALAIRLKLFGEVHPDTASSFNNLGIIYKELGDYPKAKKNYERALAIRLKLFGEAHPDTAMSFNNLGNVYTALGDYPKAKEYYERALAIKLKLFGEEHSSTADSLNNLGVVYHKLGVYSQAEENYKRALAIYLKLFDEAHLNVANVLVALGILYDQMNLKDLAILYQKMAVNIIQLTRSRITTLDKELRKSFLQSKEGYYHDLADLLISQGRIYEAQQVLAMLKEEEYFDFIRRDAERSDPRVTTASYSNLEKQQVALFQELSGRLFANHEEKTKLLEKKKATKESQWNAGKDAKRLRELEGVLEKLTRDFLAFLRNVENNLKTAGKQREFTAGAEFFAEIQGTLKEMGQGAALVHTLIAPEHVWLVLTTPDTPTPRKFKVEIPRKELYEKIRTFRDSLEARWQDPIPMARELYNILLAPLSKELEKSNTLMFYLDGPLRYIPVAALHDGERWLAERYAVVVYTEAARERLKDKREVKPGAWEAAALGVTEAHPGFSALPAVRPELESIVRSGSGSNGVIPGVIRMDKDFTEFTFADALTKRTPVVHIASHFKLEFGSVADSYLLLGDGKRLTLEKVNAGTFSFAKVEQLTLSACNTAINLSEGAGREMEGLGVLAQKRGAKSVIATLWSIADDSTSVFMPRFYKRIQEGATKAEALRQTQAEFISGKWSADLTKKEAKKRGRPVSSGGGEASPFPGFSHPFYWAPFILMGNWL